MDQTTLAQQRVGATLCNTWRLERLLGTGSLAAVYGAARFSGEREAVKILHADIAEIPGVRDRFAEAARLAGRVRHPGAVAVREVREADDGAPFVVMELLEGEPLAAVASRLGGVAVGELLRLTDDLLDVLAAAHATGVIHQGVTPENLFIEKGGRLKVLDFCLARVADGLPASVRVRLGLAADMAPEQAKGLALDVRADLFAVGATMFRVLARRRVHEASRPTELLARMAKDPAPPLASFARAAPRELAAIVDRALTFERDRRYPDARAMQGDVRALRAGKPPPYAAARRDEAPGEVQIQNLEESANEITMPRLPGLGASAAAPGAAATPALPSLVSRDSAPDTPTRIAKTVIRPPVASITSEVTTGGGDLATRPTLEAPPPTSGGEREPGSALPRGAVIEAPETPTVARNPGEVFVPGTEPTLNSVAVPLEANDGEPGALDGGPTPLMMPRPEGLKAPPNPEGDESRDAITKPQRARRGEGKGSEGKGKPGLRLALVVLGLAALLGVISAMLWMSGRRKGGRPPDEDGSSPIRASSAGATPRPTSPATAPGAGTGTRLRPSSATVSAPTGAPTKPNRGGRR